jgi:hypothetical protein
MGPIIRVAVLLNASALLLGGCKDEGTQAAAGGPKGAPMIPGHALAGQLQKRGQLADLSFIAGQARRTDGTGSRRERELVCPADHGATD